MDVELALVGLGLSAVAWLGGALVNVRTHAAFLEQLPRSWQKQLFGDVALAGLPQRPLRSLAGQWRAILAWMGPIAVGVALLHWAAFPTEVTLLTLGAYALFSTGAEWSYGTAERRRLEREIGSSAPRNFMLAVTFLGSLAASKLGFFLLPAFVALTVLKSIN